MRRLLIPVLFLAACQPPPPAPEGLDESSRYLVREFYSDDATFQAGLQGYLAWFRDDGAELLDVENTVDNIGEFQLQNLADTDVAHLPLTGGNDVGLAAGVVSLAVMNCPIRESERLLMRRDQHNLFDDFEDYERTYLTSRDDYLAGWDDGFAAVNQPLDPFADGFDGAPYASSILQTDSMIDPAYEFPVGNFPPYPMHLDFRHGVFDIDGEATEIFTILTFIEEGTVNEGGTVTLDQSFSMEVNAVWDDGSTLRTLAVWIEGRDSGGALDPDDPIVLNSALNKSKQASQRMTEICEGTFAIPDEPS